MTDKVRVAVIGTGFGTLVHVPAFMDCPDAEVVAISSGQVDRARSAAEQLGIPRWSADYREVVGWPEVDAVSIASPAYLHHPMTMAALEQGKHVLCEKPLALNVRESGEMQEAAQRRGLVHMTCFEFRWTPARAYTTRLIRDGYVGHVRHINISLYLPSRGGSLASPYLNWAAQRKMGGGMLMALGSHYIDALRLWMGEPTGVYGQVYTHGPARQDPVTGATVPADADDAFSCVLNGPQGAWASITASMAAPFGSGTRLEIYGSEGALFMSYPSFNPPPEGKLYGARAGEKEPHEVAIPPEYFPFNDERDLRMMPFRLMVQEFVDGIRTGKPAAPSFEDGLRAQAVMDGVFQASDEGRWVALES